MSDQQEITTEAGAEDALSEAFFNENMAEEAPETPEAAPVEASTETPVSPAVEEQPKPETQNTETVPSEQTAAATIQPPVGMREEEIAQFNALPPEMQKYVSEREASRDGLLTSKSQEVSKQNQEVQQRLSAINEQAQQLEAALALGAFAKPELPNQELLNSDPYTYQQQVAQYQKQLEDHQKIEGVLAQVKEEQTKAETEAYQQWQANEGQRLVELLPIAADPVRWAPERDKVIEYAKTNYGITDEQVPTVGAVNWALAHKAMQWDALQEQTKNILETAPVAPKQNSGGARAREDKPSDAADQFIQNPTEDALTAFYRQEMS